MEYYYISGLILGTLFLILSVVTIIFVIHWAIMEEIEISVKK